MLMDDDGVVPGCRKVLENAGDLEEGRRVASIRGWPRYGYQEEEDHET
jgi:hypothetical protein